MGAMSREKGRKAELEVVAMLREAGFQSCYRTPNSGGLVFKGDVGGIPKIHVEVKRQERWSLMEWIRQAWADAPDGITPIVWFRRNRAKLDDPCGLWWVAVPAGHYLMLLSRDA